MHEDKENNVVTATFEFPGFSEDEVQVDFKNGKLSVSAETKKSEEHAETGYTLRERLHGKLSRTLQLPEGVQVCRSLLNIFEWLLTVVLLFAKGWAHQSDFEKRAFDSHVSKKLAWTGSEEDCDPDLG